MIFVGHCIAPKIMKFIFGTLICYEEAYIKFWGHLEQVYFWAYFQINSKFNKSKPKLLGLGFDLVWVMLCDQ